MTRFLDRLGASRVLVADGATGTNLQQAGLKSGEHPEDWVYTQREEIAGLEKSFVEAGADIILTCTFGGSRPRLAGSKHAGRVAELNQTAAELARDAASTGNDVLVAGSMGPLGQLLRPLGPISPEEAFAAYAEQAAALSEGGVDLIVIETQFALEEGVAALKGAQSVTHVPIVVSFSFDRGTRTMMGLKPTDAAARFRDLGATMIGVNCGTTLQNALTVLEEYARAVSDFPLWAKPNAGLPRMEEGVAIYDVSPQRMADFAAAAIERGARVVGGCCGSTPEHVRWIARVVKGTPGAGNL
jgi:5-methyltetrahydrofolate--homocysteine methyltransferase